MAAPTSNQTQTLVFNAGGLRLTCPVATDINITDPDSGDSFPYQTVQYTKGSTMPYISSTSSYLQLMAMGAVDTIVSNHKCPKSMEGAMALGDLLGDLQDRTTLQKVYVQADTVCDRKHKTVHGHLRNLGGKCSRAMALVIKDLTVKYSYQKKIKTHCALVVCQGFDISISVFVKSVSQILCFCTNLIVSVSICVQWTRQCVHDGREMGITVA